jgi:bifunctional ADP-heptose synthase (sugar kinase/adenylyltransferase)
LISDPVPDILVKRSDYLTENIVGADVVNSVGCEGENHRVCAGYSTTRLVEKIKKT